MKHTLLLSSLFLLNFPAFAQNNGDISPQMLKEIQSKNTQGASDKIIANALANSSINQLAKDRTYRADEDEFFSDKVNSKGISNQFSSGRCWLFTGLNVMRSKMIAKYNLGEFQFSQNYCFFWDQLEKSNLFLQAVIDNAQKPMDDKLVEWLFKNPISDGGQFTGISDIISKYGVVPAEVMPETYNSNNTSQMRNILATKLREYGLTLRAEYKKDKKAESLTRKKTEMLATIYRILVRCLGEPPTAFTWTMIKADGKPVGTETYTPKSFYEKYVAADLQNNYVMVMNDPSRPFYACYEIDLDRHRYDGHNWKYVNLPIEDIKKMAISSIKDSTMLYFSCDVGKFLDSQKGLLDIRNYDYQSLFDTDFPMSKKERIQTFASGSTHAMTLMAVDLDGNGASRKWMVENSWGATNGHKGHLIMTDEWFNEYMFRLVVEKKYVLESVLDILKKKPILLPAWDPMFSPEQ